MATSAAFRSRRLVLSALCLAFSAAAADRIDYPPTERRFSSPSHAFVLVVRTADNWKTPRPIAELRRAGGSVIWQHPLPHYHGPRFALVADNGAVVLVDEWINVVSRYAVILIDPLGRTVAVHPAEGVFSLLAVPRRDISAHARFGVWLSGIPAFSSDGGSVVLESDGRRIELSLKMGSLTLGNRVAP